jgi:hypothetical protein
MVDGAHQDRQCQNNVSEPRASASGLPKSNNLFGVIDAIMIVSEVDKPLADARGSDTATG